MSAKFEAESLQDELHTTRLGRTIIFSHEVNSTNEWAKELAIHGAEEGTVAIAETQSKGRGRLGREWISPVGGLWFSVVLRPTLSPNEAVKLSFVAGLVVAKVLHEMFDLQVSTKWPNDVLVNGQKICGILSEMNTTDKTVNFVVVGLGINGNFDAEKVFPNHLRKVVTSLENELGRKVQLEKLFVALLERLEMFYDQFNEEGFDPILKEWKNYASFLGHQVEVRTQTEKIRGFALDIDPEGALLLKFEDGTVKQIFVGDISFQTK